MIAPLTIFLIIVIVLLIILIIGLVIYYFWSIRESIIRNNLTYAVQQGASNSPTDIFDIDEYDIYIANKAPINITIASSNNNKGKMIYISNPNSNQIFTSAGDGLVLLQSSNMILPRSYAIYVFIDKERATRLF